MVNITLNIGGTTFVTDSTTLETAHLLYNQVVNNQTRFFDKDPDTFRYVLNYLRGYEIVYPKNKNQLVMLLQDSEYYGVENLYNDTRIELITRYPSSYEYYTVEELQNLYNDEIILSKEELIVKIKNKNINILRTIIKKICTLLGYEQLLSVVPVDSIVSYVIDNNYGHLVSLLHNTLETESTNDLDDLYNDVVNELKEEPPQIDIGELMNSVLGNSDLLKGLMSQAML
jgi:hypothetical protein